MVLPASNQYITLKMGRKAVLQFPVFTKVTEVKLQLNLLVTLTPFYLVILRLRKKR
jgi:hypothetical protein